MRSATQLSRRGEAGYTLLILMFLIASMIIVLTAATPSVVTQGRREREEEMIWRGNQYVRAIGLYYRKFGKYPTKIDDLYQNTNGLRFLREKYTDPMNTTDGTWRLIYLGPNGQLIGSVNYTNILQMSMQGPAAMGAPGTSSPGAAGTPQSTNPFGAPGAAPGGTTPQAGGAQTPDQGGFGESRLGGEVIGGNIIGVGSKVKKSSIKVWNGASDYYHWEFIWKPIQVVGAPAQAAPPAAGTTATPSPSPGTPGNPPPNTPAPPPNPD
jgi:type II secretory pathway pseudopilin PulG